MLPRTLAFAAILVAAPFAQAWNKPGHMIVAAIAYDMLKAEHPQTVAKALAILKAHPEADTFGKRVAALPAGISQDDKDHYLFMVAARWPDDVRSEKGGYSHATWHYVDFPIVFPADRGKVTPAPPDKENALTAIDAEGKQLRNATDPARQAVALCWVEHLVGDLHQPLHCCTLYSQQFPEGDRGGNLEALKVNEQRATIELHQLWDDLMTSSERYQTCAKIAADLERRPDLARDKLAGVDDLTPYDWAWESYRDAVHAAYLDGALKSSVSAGSRAKKDPNALALPEGYPQAAKAVAERRIVMAGYRLADVLVKVLGQ